MTTYRSSWIEIDADAIEHNARMLAGLVAPSALCAVVKADGYGHGALDVARAALRGSASSLAVALVEEGIALRDGGIDAPVLLLSEPSFDAADDIVRFDLTPTLYTHQAITALREAVARTSSATPFAVQVKVDTGMHRVGCSAEELVSLVGAIADAPELEFEALWSHLSVADRPGDPFVATQLARFREAEQLLKKEGLAPRRLHLANSAAAIAHPETRFDMVRCGIALYGYLPSPDLAALAATSGLGATDLRPALSLHSRVHAIRKLDAGERPSYGRVNELRQRSTVATVPLGYADGVSWRLQETGGEVLIGGVRRPFAGRVTMDQVLIDCGDDETVQAGDEVVFIGRQANEEILATEWAGRLGTLVYEVLCAMGPRVPRVVVRADRPA